MPLSDERDKDKKKLARSALLLECFEPIAPLEVYLGKLEVVAKHAAPALYNSAEYYRVPMRWIWMPIAYVQDGMGGQAKAITYSVIAGLVALICVLLFVPYPLKVDASGKIWPINRREVYSPAPGEIIAYASGLKSGDAVDPRSELITMFDLKLAEQIQGLRQEIAVAENKIRILGAGGNAGAGGAGAGDRENEIALNEAKVTLDAKQSMLKDLLQRTNADPAHPGRFVIRPPMAGVVLSANFKEHIGKRVQPNEPLLKVGAANLKNPKTGEWELELKIPQKHVGQVLLAFQRKGAKDEIDVDFLIDLQKTRVFTGKLHKTKIAKQADPGQNAQAEPEPVVLAWVRISGDDIPKHERLPIDLLLAGTDVHTRIRCGNYASGYSLFYGLWEFIYEKVVFPLT